MTVNEKLLTGNQIVTLFDLLNLEYIDFFDNLNLGINEANLLDMNTIKELIDQFCFFGCDGTSSTIADDQRSPFYVSCSVVAWGQIGARSKTYKYEQHFFISSRKEPHRSSIRTVLELKMLTCIITARKEKEFNCSGCPFKSSKCSIPAIEPKPWKIFLNKEAIGLTDLPVDFSFIRVLGTLDTKNREFLTVNIKNVFKSVRGKELPILFITHKSYITEVKKKLTSQLDEALTNLDEQTKTLKKELAKLLGKKSIDLTYLDKLREQINDINTTDFDILHPYLQKIGRATPAFYVTPDDINNEWEELNYHYLTWGYNEMVNSSITGYAPSCWVRIGYTPSLTPDVAHKIICMEMMLGKGHSISLTMAHSACNLFKRLIIPTMQEYFNKRVPDIQKIGFNVKNINKWQLFS